jgi:D-alanine-D-alanine ligase
LTTNIKPLRVALLCGGKSSERDISLAGAANVRGILESSGHTVIVIDTADKDFIKQIADTNADVAFVLLHGRGGEDGTVQGLLELMGIPYTGSGVLASATAMDKQRSKIVYEHASLKTPRSVCFSKDTCAGGLLDEKGKQYDMDDLVRHIGLPCVVKPACDGSSVGVSIVQEEENLEPAITAAFGVCERLLIETYIDGTEVTVPVLGTKEPMALSVIEVVPKNEFYDFESKYSDGGCEHIIPARITDEQTQACKDVAIAAHMALGCSGMSRTDMILDKDGTPWVIETNTIPGMTDKSLLPHDAQHDNISTSELYNMLISYAIEEHSCTT